MISEYIDWSDDGLSKRENGEKSSKFGELEICLDSHGLEVELHLRRNSNKKRDFSLFVDAKKLYGFLKEHLGE